MKQIIRSYFAANLITCCLRKLLPVPVSPLLPMKGKKMLLFRSSHKHLWMPLQKLINISGSTFLSTNTEKVWKSHDLASDAIKLPISRACKP